jgi:hypothetical protein
VYTNSTNDKILIIREDVWNKIIRKAKKKFPNMANDCNRHYQLPIFAEYNLLDYLLIWGHQRTVKQPLRIAQLKLNTAKQNSLQEGRFVVDAKENRLFLNKSMQ